MSKNNEVKVYSILDEISKALENMQQDLTEEIEKASEVSKYPNKNSADGELRDNAVRSYKAALFIIACLFRDICNYSLNNGINLHRGESLISIPYNDSKSEEKLSKFIMRVFDNSSLSSIEYEKGYEELTNNWEENLCENPIEGLSKYLKNSIRIEKEGHQIKQGLFESKDLFSYLRSYKDFYKRVNNKEKIVMPVFDGHLIKDMEWILSEKVTEYPEDLLSGFRKVDDLIEKLNGEDR